MEGFSEFWVNHWSGIIQLALSLKWKKKTWKSLSLIQTWLKSFCRKESCALSSKLFFIFIYIEYVVASLIAGLLDLGLIPNVWYRYEPVKERHFVSQGQFDKHDYNVQILKAHELIKFKSVHQNDAEKFLRNSFLSLNYSTSIQQVNVETWFIFYSDNDTHQRFF